MASSLIVTEKPYWCRVQVWHGEHWYDPIPQWVDPVSGDPWDLTSVTLELIARPSANHATRLVLLTSTGSAGILKENAAQGLSAISYSQANVEANLPITNKHGWEQFLRASFTDPDIGAIKRILWEGPLIVHPAKDTATP